MNNKKSTMILIPVIGIIVFIVVFLGISLTKNAGKSAKTVNAEEATATIQKYVKKIAPGTAQERKSAVELVNNEIDELPEIDKNEVTV